jgi:hypothetical protein
MREKAERAKEVVYTYITIRIYWYAMLYTNILGYYNIRILIY